MSLTSGIVKDFNRGYVGNHDLEGCHGKDHMSTEDMDKQLRKENNHKK